MHLSRVLMALAITSAASCNSDLCIRNIECRSTERCVLGICRPFCRNAAACLPTEQCIDQGCVPIIVPTPVVDGGQPAADAGTPGIDAGQPADAGPPPGDAGAPDAGIDAGSLDAGTTLPDGGVDAGSLDAGTPDAGGDGGP